MRISCAGFALLTAILVAGCGGSSSTTVSNAVGTGGAAETQTVTRTVSAPAATSSERTPGSTGGAGVGSATGAPVSGTGAPACTAAALALSFLGGQGATGHGELGFALRNTGSSACSTVGYPGIQFLDRSGGPLPTDPVHTTSDFFGHTALRALSVAAGHTVSFRLGVTHNPTAGQSCTTAYGVQVIAPNDSATLGVDLPGGAAECAVTTVSPMQPGDAAYP